MVNLTEVDDFTVKVKARLKIPNNIKDFMLASDPTGKLVGRPPFMPSAIVENDVELNNQKGAVESFGNVFKWWKRISRGGTTFTDNFIPAELNAWTYDSATDRISNPINSSSTLGFVSPEKYDDYVFESRVSSTNGDDDAAGLIIAYATDPATGDTHTLSVIRCGNGIAPMYVVKDFASFAGEWGYLVGASLNGLTWFNDTVATGPSENNSNGGWSLKPTGCLIRVTRTADIIKVETTQYGSDVYFPAATITFDLKSNPELAIFRGPQSIGYTVQSQADTTWQVLKRPDSRLTIVDIRDWSKWTYSPATDIWTKATGTKDSLIAEGLLIPGWMHQNVTSSKFFYMDSTKRLYRV